MENNWRNKSLQSLEKDDWGKTPAGASRLVIRCHELRQIPLSEFTTEDIRIMIGQQIGLNYVIPLAIEKLKQSILAEGDLYPGDLLVNITNVPTKFWSANKSFLDELKELIKTSREQINEEGLRIGSDW